jgi:hypothetical protein
MWFLIPPVRVTGLPEDPDDYIVAILGAWMYETVPAVGGHGARRGHGRPMDQIRWAAMNTRPTVTMGHGPRLGMNGDRMKAIRAIRASMSTS